MSINQAFTELREIVDWINDNTTGLQLPTDRRSQIVCGCFDVALEHQAAIVVLCDSELYGSMLALLRVHTEAVVRGLWLQNCATEKELDYFEKRGIEKSFGELIEEIEAVVGENTTTLSQMKTNAWKAMNGFTHTGFIQVTRRHSEHNVGANYPEEDIIRCLNAVGGLGLIASMQLSAIAGNDALVQEHLNVMPRYATAT